MRDFKISVSNLRSGQSKSFNYTVPEKLWHLPEEDIEIVKPIQIDGILTHAGDFFLLKLKVQTRIRLKCTRCLEEFEKDYLFDIEEQLRHADHEDNLEELTDDEILYSTFLGQEIDIQQIVVEHLVLNLPLKRLCKIDCQGLCPICGQDRNLSHCNCEEDIVDPRLQALKQLLKEKDYS